MLKAERDRAGVGFAKLLSTTENVPDGLTDKIIFTWLGKTKSARRNHLAFVLERYAALPTLERAAPLHPYETEKSARLKRLERRVGVTPKLSRYAPIAAEKRSTMKLAFHRSGVSYKSLMLLIAREHAGISQQMVSGWISGRTKTARPEHIECVLGILERLADEASLPFSDEALKNSREARLKPHPTPPKAKPKVRVIEPPTIKKTRTLAIADPRVVTPRKSDIIHRKILPDLTPDRWLVKREWTAIDPKTAQSLRYPEHYRLIDEATYDRLHAELRRTCVSPSLLLNTYRKAPKSLPARRISEWMRLVTRSGEKALIDWVLKAYALLPDASAD